jgi:hypothetical protein
MQEPSNNAVLFWTSGGIRTKCTFTSFLVFKQANKIPEKGTKYCSDGQSVTHQTCVYSLQVSLNTLNLYFPISMKDNFLSDFVNHEYMNKLGRPCLIVMGLIHIAWEYPMLKPYNI